MFGVGVVCFVLFAGIGVVWYVLCCVVGSCMSLRILNLLGSLSFNLSACGLFDASGSECAVVASLCLLFGVCLGVVWVCCLLMCCCCLGLSGLVGFVFCCFGFVCFCVLVFVCLFGVGRVLVLLCCVCCLLCLLCLCVCCVSSVCVVCVNGC